MFLSFASHYRKPCGKGKMLPLHMQSDSHSCPLTDPSPVSLPCLWIPPGLRAPFGDPGREASSPTDLGKGEGGFRSQASLLTSADWHFPVLLGMHLGRQAMLRAQHGEQHGEASGLAGKGHLPAPPSTSLRHPWEKRPLSLFPHLTAQGVDGGKIHKYSLNAPTAVFHKRGERSEEVIILCTKLKRRGGKKTQNKASKSVLFAYLCLMKSMVFYQQYIHFTNWGFIDILRKKHIRQTSRSSRQRS